MGADLLAEMRETAAELRAAVNELRELSDRLGRLKGDYARKFHTERARLRVEHPGLRVKDLDDEATRYAMEEHVEILLLEEVKGSLRRKIDALQSALTSLQSELRTERELAR